ncbi:Os11g0111101, partial [Oryza sativa Japonica Group]
RVPSESLAQFFGPIVTSSSGVVTLLRALLRYPSSLGKELWVKTLSSLWMDDSGVFWRRDPREGVILESSCRSGVVSSVAIGLA